MSTTPSPSQNHLLAGLSPGTQARIFPHLELVVMPLGKVLYEPGEVMNHGYFPADSIVSLLATMDNGESAEIAMVGNEGVLGVSLFMGGGSTPSRAVVQSAGTAYRLPAAVLKREFEQRGDLQKLMLRYTESLVAMMTQVAACNRHHSIQQQFCRWLLLSLDRLPDMRLIMTQGLIANMLGVRLDGMISAADKLQQMSVLRYDEGQVTVLNRGQVERLSCECYGVIKKETDRLLAYAHPPKPAEIGS